MSNVSMVEVDRDDYPGLPDDKDRPTITAPLDPAGNVVDAQRVDGGLAALTYENLFLIEENAGKQTVRTRIPVRMGKAIAAVRGGRVLVVAGNGSFPTGVLAIRKLEPRLLRRFREELSIVDACENDGRIFAEGDENSEAEFYELLDVDAASDAAFAAPAEGPIDLWINKYRDDEYDDE